MSFGSRLAIGTLALICAAWYFAAGLHIDPAVPNRALLHYFASFFFILIVLACFWAGSRPVTVRLLGAILAVAFGSALWLNWNDLNLAHVIWGFIMLFLPSVYAAVRGRYTTWGEASAAFNNYSDPPQEDQEKD